MSKTSLCGVETNIFKTKTMGLLEKVNINAENLGFLVGRILSADKNLKLMCSQKFHISSIIFM